MAGAPRFVELRPVQARSHDVKIDARLAETLRIVATTMAMAEDPWWIIAGAAVALHGASPVTVGDVDVLLSVADARRLLPSIGIPPRCGAEHPDFRSTLFGTWLDPPLAVEFMAGFHHRRETQWFAVQPATRRPVPIAQSVVYIPERDELREMLMAFGRAKDLERAALLDASDRPQAREPDL